MKISLIFVTNQLDDVDDEYLKQALTVTIKESSMTHHRDIVTNITVAISDVSS